VDCSAIPETLIESELFGHEKGAYTGAISAQAGKFELAKGGTLFLDEIGNLPKSVQAKLLRVIQERELFRLGGTKPIRVNVHLIAATNRDLSKAVGAGEFREDLYHRLNVFPIALPSLRERGEDILLLSHYFLEKFSKELGKSVKELSREAEALLTHYRWPGNVREVENAVKHALLMVSDGEKTILPKHLPESIREAPSVSQAVGDGSLRTASKGAAQKVERELILKTLKETNWNKRRASQILKVDYKTLFNKLKEHSIPARMS
jgi:transcriptional regulator with GAF, ATPase, and Fis domain